MIEIPLSSSVRSQTFSSIVCPDILSTPLPLYLVVPNQRRWMTYRTEYDLRSKRLPRVDDLSHPVVKENEAVAHCKRRSSGKELRTRTVWTPDGRNCISFPNLRSGDLRLEGCLSRQQTTGLNALSSGPGIRMFAPV